MFLIYKIINKTLYPLWVNTNSTSYHHPVADYYYYSEPYTLERFISVCCLNDEVFDDVAGQRGNRSPGSGRVSLWDQTAENCALQRQSSGSLQSSEIVQVHVHFHKRFNKLEIHWQASSSSLSALFRFIFLLFFI